jgi:methylthioribulose-1-phosphate dehydratase
MAWAVSRTASLPSIDEATHAIIAVGRAFDTRGWAPATAGNYSMRLPGNRFAITASGAHKGRLTTDDVITVDNAGQPLDGGTPSAETALHMALYRRFDHVGAVLHSHSPTAVALTRVLADANDWIVEGHELLKVFPGINTHKTRLAFPIVDNSQDMGDIKRAIAPRLLVNPPPPAYLIRGHGLYGWGRDMAEAERVIEAVEWLIAAEFAERSFGAGRTG